MDRRCKASPCSASLLSPSVSAGPLPPPTSPSPVPSAPVRRRVAHTYTFANDFVWGRAACRRRPASSFHVCMRQRSICTPVHFDLLHLHISSWPCAPYLFQKPLRIAFLRVMSTLPALVGGVCGLCFFGNQLYYSHKRYHHSYRCH